MKLIKQKSEFGTIIYLKERGRYLGFSYAGNLDLYLTINGKVDKPITITKENYNLYKAFETLYSDIENINIFDYVESEDIYEYNKMVEEFRERCRKNNQYNYNELFDKKRRTITWYSDETAKEAANYVTIKKQKDAFVLRFYTQSPKTDYNPDFNSKNHISIRIRNARSRYAPFNILFMKMYNNMVEIDDVNDNNHQIHMEEYLYRQKQLIKKRSVE